MTENEDANLTTADVAAMLATTEKTVLRHRQRKGLKVKWLGDEYRWTRSQVAQLLDDEPKPNPRARRHPRVAKPEAPAPDNDAPPSK